MNFKIMLESAKYILEIAIISFLFLVLIGTIYQAIDSAKDFHKYPPPGKLIDLGGYKLHLNCQGEGEITVVMDYGLGGLSSLWSLVQSEVTKFTKVCTYDRAGYGWSDRSPNPRTSQQLVRELHLLLTKAEIKPPYILVGHSLGGLNMRLFASQYPDEVKGIVLVDAVPTDVYSRLNPQFQNYIAKVNKMFFWLSIWSRFGFLRLGTQLLGNKVTPDFVRKLPTEVQSIVLAQFCPKTFNTAIAESLLMEDSAKQVSQTKLPKDLPLAVLSHGINMFSNLSVSEAEKAELVWQKLQAETASLTSKGTTVQAQKSGHDIHIDCPQLVIDGIRQMI
jgi:pimeloyl-ACP methyl ester carboxylesterase